MATRVANKSLASRCNEQESDQMSIATQLGCDMHKSMQSATDDSG